MLKKKLLGIGLLELMLSLAIIAVLLVMATRYYAAVRNEQQTNEAVTMVQQIMGAADNWYATYHDFSVGKGINISALINLGMLPPNFQTSPWGTQFEIVSNGPASTNIFLHEIAQADCLNLEAMLCAKHLLALCQVDQNSYLLLLNYPANLASTLGFCTSSQ